MDLESWNRIEGHKTRRVDGEIDSLLQQAGAPTRDRFCDLAVSHEVPAASEYSVRALLFIAMLLLAPFLFVSNWPSGAGAETAGTAEVTPVLNASSLGSDAQTDRGGRANTG